LGSQAEVICPALEVTRNPVGFKVAPLRLEFSSALISLLFYTDLCLEKAARNNDMIFQEDA
jgi:hypothetical protein